MRNSTSARVAKPWLNGTKGEAHFADRCATVTVSCNLGASPFMADIDALLPDQQVVIRTPQPVHIQL
jgi:hypothetical protein